VPISDAEGRVMEVLWSRNPQSAEDVASGLSSRQEWTLSTVKTLINRLLNKGAIQAEKSGRRFLYSPVIERADFVEAESRDLLDRFFGGRLAPLVSHFSNRGGLSGEDIAELKRLIEELDDGD